MLRKWILATLSLVICQVSFAATTAIDFAQQAGSIAGAAAACGQNISVFMQRTQEALNLMAVNDLDKSTAMQAFQQNLLNVQMRQAQKPTLPCSQVLQDYAALPLLQDDYKTSVLPKLAPASNTSLPATTNTSAAATNAPSTSNPSASNTDTTASTNNSAPNTTVQNTPTSPANNSVNLALPTTNSGPAVNNAPAS